MIWKTDGSNSLEVSGYDYQNIKAMLNMLPDDGKMIPNDYKIKVGSRYIPLRQITLEQPESSKLSEQRLDILS